MSIDYAHEKLSAAVYSLATGAGRVQERLADAALVLIRLKPDDFPDDGDLRRSFVGVMDDLTYEQPQQEGEGRISATLKVTSDYDASEIAKRILALYHAVDRVLRPL